MNCDKIAQLRTLYRFGDLSVDQHCRRANERKRIVDLSNVCYELLNFQMIGFSEVFAQQLGHVPNNGL